MPMRARIDFNCDLGEGCGDDAAILPYVSSASIACGLHAGGPATMAETVALCVRHGVAIGAHPGYDDRAHFGRRDLSLSPREIHALVLYQIGALHAFCVAAGVRLRHVKPHGALYNLAARDDAVGAAVADAVRAFDPALVLFGLSGGASLRAAQARGLRVAHEVFAERRYDADGSLTPRTQPDAVIADVDVAAQQVADMLASNTVRTRNGAVVPIRADTVCLHGDRTDAAVFARRLRAAIEEAGYGVRPPFAEDASNA